MLTTEKGNKYIFYRNILWANHMQNTNAVERKQSVRDLINARDLKEEKEKIFYKRFQSAF